MHAVYFYYFSHVVANAFNSRQTSVWIYESRIEIVQRISSNCIFLKFSGTTWVHKNQGTKLIAWYNATFQIFDT